MKGRSDYDQRIIRLRLISSFFVVLIHVTAYGFYANTDYWICSVIYNSMGRACVPLFFMISGTLLIRKNEDLKTWARKGFNKVLLPYCIWGSIYILYRILTGEGASVQINIFHAAPYYHLPFMLSYTGYYLMLPLIRGFWNSPQTTKQKKVYAVTLAVFSTIVFEFLQSVCGLSFLNASFYLFPSHIAYSMLGVLIWETATNESSVPSRNGRGRKCFIWLMMYISGAALTAFLTIMITRGTQRLTESFLVYSSPLVMLSATGLFLLFRDFPAKRQVTPFLSHISQNSFHIYLFHPLLLTILINYGIVWNLFFPPVWLLVYTLVVYAISSLFAFGVNRLKQSFSNKTNLVFSLLVVVVILGTSIVLKYSASG